MTKSSRVKESPFRSTRHTIDSLPSNLGCMRPRVSIARRLIARPPSSSTILRPPVSTFTSQPIISLILRFASLWVRLLAPIVQDDSLLEFHSIRNPKKFRRTPLPISDVAPTRFSSCGRQDLFENA